MRKFAATASIAALIGGLTAALAQQGHSPSHGHSPAQAPGQLAGKGAAAADTREFVKFPEQLVEHTLANMRDHLAALQEIQDHLGMGNGDLAARIAETRLGMSSLGLHGAHDVAKFMPQGMQNAGTAMHRAASRFAIVAIDAGVSGDLKPVFSALSEVTAACVGCHAGYRIK